MRIGGNSQEGFITRFIMKLFPRGHLCHKEKPANCLLHSAFAEWSTMLIA